MGWRFLLLCRRTLFAAAKRVRSGSCSYISNHDLGRGFSFLSTSNFQWAMIKYQGVHFDGFGVALCTDSGFLSTDDGRWRLAVAS